MAEIEMNLRKTDDRRLAVFGVLKHRLFSYTIHIIQCLAQEHIGRSRELASLLVLESHKFLPPLFPHKVKCGIKVNPQRILVYI